MFELSKEPSLVVLYDGEMVRSRQVLVRGDLLVVRAHEPLYTDTSAHWLLVQACDARRFRHRSKMAHETMRRRWYVEKLVTTPALGTILEEQEVARALAFLAVPHSYGAGSLMTSARISRAVKTQLSLVWRAPIACPPLGKSEEFFHDVGFMGGVVHD